VPALLNGASADGGTARETEGTPQFVASEWILNNNPQLAEFSADRILQRYALATLYHSTNGPTKWGDRELWITEADECEWVDVICEDTNEVDEGVVTNVVIAENGLEGEVPPEMGMLTNLVQLSMWGNDLGPTIPTELALLTRLESLELDLNNFIGRIPSEMGQLSELSVAHFSSNELEGAIPDTFVNLQGATELYFQENLLTGVVPEGMCNLPSLTKLQVDCAEVNCTCCSPSCIIEPRPLEEYLTLLTEVSSVDGGAALQEEGSPQRLALEWIATDDISHAASPDNDTIYSRYALATFYYAMDGENWEESDGWLSNQPLCDWNFVEAECEGGLVYGFGIFSDTVVGALPPELLLLSNMNFFELGGAQIDTPIPDWLSFPSMGYLGLTNCGLLGSIPQSLTQMSNLEGLSLYANDLDGNVPVDVLATLTKLTFLDLGNNQYTGEVPEGLNALTDMKILYLEENGNLTGIVHESYTTAWTQLEILGLRDCNMTGSFPAAMWTIPTLKSMELDGNNFLDVDFPLENRSPLLERISVSGTRLTLPTIPVELAQQHPSLRTIDMSVTEVGGPIPTELGLLVNLTNLYLYETNVDGTIPSELGAATSLVELAVSQTNLDGTVPTEVGALPDLIRIYLEQTNILGPLPDEEDQFCKNQESEDGFDFWTDCDEVGGCACCTYCCVDEEGCEEVAEQ